MGKTPNLQITAKYQRNVFFFKRNFKNNFEKIWKKEKGFLSLLHRNDYLFTFKNSREL
jgi:hypothetical protein